MGRKAQNFTGSSSKCWDKKSQHYCMWHTIKIVKQNSWYTFIKMRGLLTKVIEEVSQGRES